MKYLISLPFVTLILACKVSQIPKKLSDVEVVILTVTLHRKYGNILGNVPDGIL